jgi:1-deoxy-D-xylulose-5-phosphate synthase
MNPVLNRLVEPGDIERLSVEELDCLAAEVRTLIVDTVRRTGGHLAANLGVVELTIALLRTFRPPADKIVWDVSHQTYAYKILTDRRARFATLRQLDGISGFLKRDESPFDAFGSGHSGTALSAAMGMAVARDLRGSGEHVVAVLGDGAAGCGISLEAFNNVSHTTNRLIVILNDNEMSIAANVGGLSRYLGKLLANPRYNRWKRSVERSIGAHLRVPWLRSAYFRLEEAVKSLFLRNMLFEEFGLRYVGPIDGHDFHRLLDALATARDSDQPIVLHVNTMKGRGYPPAEKHPEKWHSTGPFEITTGEQASKPSAPTYSEVFGRTLEALAEKDDRIVAITAAMASGTGLSEFERRFPRRFFDVGISEEHAAVFAAGLAAEGYRPVFAVYSTFAQRIVDCVIHDICLQNLPVVLCLDRAGLVGDDGPTHHGVFDMAIFRPIPNLVIMQPRDEAELADMLHTAIGLGSPAILRYPRGRGPGTAVPNTRTVITIGRAVTLARGKRVHIWALGDMVPLALQTASCLESDGISTGVVDARFVRPLDTALLREQAAGAAVFVTIENGVASGGFGTAVEESLRSAGFTGRVLRMGWPDAFVPQGPLAALMERHGMSPRAIAAAVRQALNSAPNCV